MFAIESRFRDISKKTKNQEKINFNKKLSSVSCEIFRKWFFKFIFINVQKFVKISRKTLRQEFFM